MYERSTHRSRGTASGTTVGAAQDGVATCGASLSSPDVWYKLTASTYGYLSVDTFGSGFDTVVSVHAACPGTFSNELTCNDDAYGVQSAASFYAYPGEEYWIRVSGFGGASGPFELHLGTGGSISGQVTSSQDGTPLAGGTVYAYNEYGYWEGSGGTDASGNYAVSALDAGSYFLQTDGFIGFLDELYDDVLCPHDSCTVTAGTPVAVSSTGEVGGVDFTLDPGGAISGLVTHAATGDPVAGASVRIYNSAGSQVGSALTDGAGAYEVTGLASGSHYAVAESSAYADELYDGIACPGGYPYYGCDPTTGTPIAVTAPLTTAGVDFALDRLGVVTGVVTETATGDPIPDVRVQVYLDEIGYYASDYTDATGMYSIGGLPAGEYVVVTDAYDHINEVFDDIPCPSYYWTCDLTAGTPIAVALDAIVSGVDFALDRFGAVSGTITHALTSGPVASVEVAIFDADGDWVDWTYTSSTGGYTFDRLPAGTYFVATDVDGSFVDELYDDLVCPGGPYSGCDPTTGTPVAVVLNATTTGIDFALDPGGAIAGTVRDAATGNPLAFAGVVVWDAAGEFLRSGSANGSGQYSVAGLAGGTYFVTSSKSGYSPQLFDGLPCAGDCDKTAGTPVNVSHNDATSGIDFALERPGAISGTVTSASTGDPIGDARVEVWDAAGSFVDYDYSYYQDGTYVIGGLPAGTYFVVVENGFAYPAVLPQLYAGFPCPGGAPAGCDPTTGTPVSVNVGATTSGIDFAVGPLGGIAGSVTEVGGEPIYDVFVELFDASGVRVTYDWTGSSGQYQFHGLAPGSYFVTADSYDYHIDEVYDDLPCPGGCDPTKGTPVVVAVGATNQVDFELSFYAIAGTVTDAATGAPLAGVSIQLWSAADYYNYYPDWTTTTDSDGKYRRILPPGTYHVVTDNALGLVDEVYAGRLCTPDSSYDGGCDPTVGTPVYVGVSGHGPLAAGVDFALDDGVAVFSDGFETGNMSAWSSSVGTP
ncbi:MAG TPA: carboxypeptidase regulatory-like domain-containing protein [Thermoanaerobaculia bacterium]